MTWLVTGGAGYIGAHVVRALLAAGERAVVVDDLSTGTAAKVPPGVALMHHSVLDADKLAAAIRAYEVTGVIHLAARKAVGQSVEQPLWYYRENVDGVATLLEVCVAEGVRRVVYSSSAAVYGAPDGATVKEDSPTRPESPYGETKLVGEWMLRDVARAHLVDWVALRYFNVAGAGAADLGDPGVFNLVPLVLRAVTTGHRPRIFGGDYPTPDGTCIRDYVHVSDLADAHVVTARALAGRGEGVGHVYNVGTGQGYSVREVLERVLSVSGSSLEPEVVARRPGDPPMVVADTAKLAADLGWRASRGLDDIVASAWESWPGRG